MKAQSLFCELHSKKKKLKNLNNFSELEESIMEVCRKQSLSQKCIEIYSELDEISDYFPETVKIMQRSGSLSENENKQEASRNRLLGLKGLDDLVELLSFEKKENQFGLKKTQQS